MRFSRYGGFAFALWDLRKRPVFLLTVFLLLGLTWLLPSRVLPWLLMPPSPLLLPPRLPSLPPAQPLLLPQPVRSLLLMQVTTCPSDMPLPHLGTAVIRHYKKAASLLDEPKGWLLCYW